MNKDTQEHLQPNSTCTDNHNITTRIQNDIHTKHINNRDGGCHIHNRTDNNNDVNNNNIRQTLVGHTGAWGPSGSLATGPVYA